MYFLGFPVRIHNYHYLVACFPFHFVRYLDLDVVVVCVCGGLESLLGECVIRFSEIPSVQGVIKHGIVNYHF
ncbi:hypothetical protein Peur_043314 [Populus x canadensis]